MATADKISGLCAATLLIGYIASSDGREAGYSPSELNANPKLYEGREVRVRGWVALPVENRNIWDAKSDFTKPEDDFSRCLALIGVQDWTWDKSIDDKVLTISGVYHQYETPEKITLGMCSNAVIEVNVDKPPFRKR
jgi:hypothetical protein